MNDVIYISRLSQNLEKKNISEKIAYLDYREER